MEIKAELNYLRMSPRKVRLVADLIRGMGTENAAATLRHLPKRAGDPVLKLLKSAIANAKHNFQIENDRGLFIREIRVDSGPILYRSRPRAFGRAAPIRKRTSHLTLLLDTKESLTVKTDKKEELMVREVTREDIKDEFWDGEAKGERKPPKTKRKSGTPDFVRRVFKRKVI